MGSQTKNPVGALSPNGRGLDPSLLALPRKRLVFPTSTRPAPIGNLVGASPITPRIIEREAKASFGQTRVRLPVNAWTAVDVDRPSILYSSTPDNNGDGPVFFYNYGRPSTTPLGENNQVSERGGVCHLSSPGQWWIYNFGGADPVDRIGLIIDGDNPEVLRKFTSRPGVNYVRENSVNLTDPTLAYEIAIGGPSNWRSAMIFQNVPNAAGTSATVRFSISQPSTYLIAGAAWTGLGFRLLVNGSMILSERQLARGSIFACLEAAGDATIEWAEFRDA